MMEFIFIGFSFLLVLILFKMIYLEKNPFGMMKFWLVQIGVVSVIFFNEWKRNLNAMLSIPYIVVFTLILVLYVIFNRGKNPFTIMHFWVSQAIGAVVVSIGFFLFIFCVLGKERSPDDTLYNDIQREEVASVMIVQRKDTIHVDSVDYFLAKLSIVKSVRGPVKYPRYGKIVFIRNDGSKDSISTNGYEFGPYKGTWYVSKENVLDEFFKK